MFPSYSIENDFSDGVADPQLHEEVAELGIAGFEGIDVTGDSCLVCFSSPPSQEDQAAVDAVVAAHDPLPYLKTQKHADFDEATRRYLQNEYSAERQTSLLDLRLDAVDNGYTNRKAYIDQFRSWLYTILGYHKGTVEPQINAATTRSELEAVTWDLSQFDAQKPDPRVEIYVAAGMMD